MDNPTLSAETPLDPASAGIAVLEDLKSSAGNSRDLTPPHITALRTLFANPDVGLWWFAREVFQFRDLTWDFHGPICQFVGHWGESHLANGQIITHTPAGGYEEDNVVHSYRRLMVRIPRECFKTSVFTRAAALRVLAMDPNETIGIFNETQDKPIQWIDAIRQVVEASILFQTLYRDIIPRGIGYWDKEAGRLTSRKQKWGGTGMLFERGSLGVAELSIEPHGITGTAVGKHFTRMIWDDIIGLKASSSPAVMQTAIDWVDNSRAIERPLEGGCVLVPHTPWAFRDTYSHMQAKWPGEFKIFHRALLENPETGDPDDVTGVSTVPFKISTKKAYKMKEADPFVFASQYQGIPKAGRSSSFQPEWDGFFHIISEGDEPVIHIDSTGGSTTYDGTKFELAMLDAPDFAPQRVPLSWCSKAIIIDPAPSKGAEVRANRNANNGIVAVAKDPWGRRFALEAIISKESPENVLEQVIALSTKWRAWVWSVEEVVFSAVYQPLWSAIMSLRPEFAHLQPQWIPVKPQGRDKEGRIRNNLIHLHETGLVHYNSGVLEKTDIPTATPVAYLTKEKNEFPYGETIDVLDAFSYIDESITTPQTPDQIQEAWWRTRHSDRGVTGYGRTTYESS